MSRGFAAHLTDADFDPERERTEHYARLLANSYREHDLASKAGNLELCLRWLNIRAGLIDAMEQELSRAQCVTAAGRAAWLARAQDDARSPAISGGPISPFATEPHGEPLD